MNITNILKNRLVTRLALVAGLLFGYLGQAAAADKVYISDFSIKAGETKEIAVNFDTDATDVKQLNGSITVPAGLSIVQDAYGQGTHAKVENSRAAGASIVLNPSTGKFIMMSNVMDKTSAFTGASGAIAYFKVKADANLAAGDYTIALSGFTAKKGSTTENISMQNATVTCAAAAAYKVYIENFSIKAGETKDIAVILETTATDVHLIEGTIELPEGLTADRNITVDETHAPGFSAGRFRNGSFSLEGDVATATSGTIAYLKVTADDGLAATSTITLSDFVINEDEETEVTTGNATVTLDTDGGGSGELALSFTENPLNIAAGETKDVEVLLTNGMTLSGLQAQLAVTDGITITGVTKSNRLNGLNYSNGRVVATGGITGNDGAVFTVTLKAADSFSGTAKLTLSNVTGTTSAAVRQPMDDIELTLTNVGGDEAFCFVAENPITITAGQTKDVEVRLTNGMALSGLQARLTASEGLTITAVTKSDRLVGMNYNNGSLIATGGISGNDGTVFTVTLQANADFAGAATLTVGNITGTTSASVRKPMENVVLNVNVEEDVTLVTRCTVAENPIAITAGQTKEVEVLLTNGMTLSGLQARLTASEGLTIAGVTKSDRLTSMNYNNGSIIATGGITGNEGAVFTVTLQANTDFVGSATLTVGNITGTTSASVRKPMDDIVLNVNVQGIAAVTTAPAAKNLTYTGAAQALVEAGVAKGGTIQYSLDGTTFAEAIPTGTNAGDYTIYYKVIPAENYIVEDAATAMPSVNVTIAKAALSAVTLTSAELFFTGEELTATVASVKAGEVVVPAEAYTVSGDKATTVGNYTLTVTAVADGNFLGQAQAQYAVVTNPADKTAFADYQTAQKAAADDLAKDGDSEAAKKIIADAKAAIDALAYDESKSLDQNKSAVDAIVAPLANALTEQRAADQLAADKSAFEAYKTQQKSAVDALAEDGDSEAAKKIIADAKAAIDALAYDETKSLADNKSAVDAIVAPLANALTEQRTADQLAADKSAFEAYKTQQKTAVDALAEDGDSEAAKKIIADAKSAIDALAYDETKSLADNKSAVDAIVAPLADALAAQREADKVIPGDVTGTGEVDPDDLDALADIILEGKEGEADMDRCDVNRDGEVDVTDLVWLRYYLVHGHWPDVAGARGGNNKMTDAVSMKLVSATGHVARLAVSLKNADMYQAFQIGITLPEGAKVVGSSLGARVAQGSLMSGTDEGSVRFLVVADKPFDGNDGIVLYVDVENLNEGEATLAEAIFTNASYASARLTGLDNTTGISVTSASVREKAGQKVYSFDGVQLNGMKKGMNIVRKTDGSTVKVMNK